MVLVSLIFECWNEFGDLSKSPVNSIYWFLKINDVWITELFFSSFFAIRSMCFFSSDGSSPIGRWIIITPSYLLCKNLYCCIFFFPGCRIISGIQDLQVSLQCPVCGISINYYDLTDTWIPEFIYNPPRWCFLHLLWESLRWAWRWMGSHLCWFYRSFSRNIIGSRIY